MTIIVKMRGHLTHEKDLCAILIILKHSRQIGTGVVCIILKRVHFCLHEFYKCSVKEWGAIVETEKAYFSGKLLLGY